MSAAQALKGSRTFLARGRGDHAHLALRARRPRLGPIVIARFGLHGTPQRPVFDDGEHETAATFGPSVKLRPPSVMGASHGATSALKAVLIASPACRRPPCPNTQKPLRLADDPIIAFEQKRLFPRCARQCQMVAVASRLGADIERLFDFE
jgi:hypothetical protein